MENREHLILRSRAATMFRAFGTLAGELQGRCSTVRAALMRRHAKVWWVFGGGIVVCVIGVLALMLRPGTSKAIIYGGLGVGMLVLYLMLLTAGLKPKFAPVDLYVDQNGVWADDAPLLARRDIAEASIRRPVASQEHRINNSGRISFVTLPAYPTTVEIITVRGGRVNIVPGSDQAASAILTALGFPVVYSPSYQRVMSFWQWRSSQ